MSNVVLTATGLRRVFGRRNKVVAVDGVNLDVEPGQVHALLGPNGAGKTTTVRMCSTLLAPTSGDIAVDGVDAVRRPRRARARLGLVLGGELGFYPRATARENLLFFADLQGLDASRRRAAVEDARERVTLTDVGDRKAGALSRGMLQRLHLARALLGRPRLLLLDETTTGLDPDVALQVRDLVRDMASQGVGVLMTSHSMPEVEELADVISVIGAGRIVTRGSVRDVAAFAGVEKTTTLTLPARLSGLSERLQDRIGDDGVVVQRPLSGQWAMTVLWTTAGLAVLGELLEKEGAAEPVDMVTRPASLEEAYLALVDGLGA